jgi:hypothetical protein
VIDEHFLEEHYELKEYLVTVESMHI